MQLRWPPPHVQKGALERNFDGPPHVPKIGPKKGGWGPHRSCTLFNPTPPPIEVALDRRGVWKRTQSAEKYGWEQSGTEANLAENAATSSLEMTIVSKSRLPPTPHVEENIWCAIFLLRERSCSECLYTVRQLSRACSILSFGYSPPPTPPLPPTQHATHSALSPPSL